MPRFPSVFTTCLSLLLVAACAADGGRPETHMDPPYDFTAGTVFDIIRADDPTSFVCLHHRGRATRQMWDKRVSREFRHKVYLYDAYFTDGTRHAVRGSCEPGIRNPRGGDGRGFSLYARARTVADGAS